MYGPCKDIVDNCLLFRPTLSVINTPTNKLAKFIVSILKSLTNSKYTVKDTYAFAEEIIEQDSQFFMGNLDVDSLFTNIPVEETIDICSNTLFENMKTVEGLSIELNEPLSLATKESYFIFNENLFKQVDGVALGSPTLTVEKKPLVLVLLYLGSISLLGLIEEIIKTSLIVVNCK